MPELFISVLDQLLNGFRPEEIGFLKSRLRRILSNYCGGDGGTGNQAGSAS